MPGSLLWGGRELGDGFGQLEQFAGAHLFQEFGILVELPDEFVGFGGDHSGISLVAADAACSGGSMPPGSASGEGADVDSVVDRGFRWSCLIRHFKMSHDPPDTVNPAPTRAVPSSRETGRRRADRPVQVQLGAGRGAVPPPTEVDVYQSRVVRPNSNGGKSNAVNAPVD